MGKLRHLILVLLLRICQILLLKKQSIYYSSVSNILIKNKTFDCNALNIINNYKQLNVKAGSTGIKAIPLSKIELVVSEKDARQVINLISKKSGFSANQGGKIFISEMEEVVDMNTLNAQQDLESEEIIFPTKPTIKRRRLVPLQKFTLIKLEKIYENNKEKLQTDYRIKSFSDFVNYCIMGYLPTVEKQLKHTTIVYGNNFHEF